MVKKNWTKYLIIFLFIFNIILYSYLITISLIVRNNKDKLEYTPITITQEHKVYKYLESNRNFIYTETRQSEIRKNIEDLIGLSCYIYKGYDIYTLKGNAWGLTQFYLRRIEVAEKISTTDYIQVMTHEAIHLKYMNANELWTNFMTFKLLYESDNIDFKQASINWAYRYVSSHTVDENGNTITSRSYQNEYDIAYNVIEYLNLKI